MNLNNLKASIYYERTDKMFFEKSYIIWRLESPVSAIMNRVFKLNDF
ncbi:MAG: hypothetical protein KBB90_00320 [Spirochaetia bacterium]|nr:hypothetical protein [Spirochaetia bacterium]